MFLHTQTKIIVQCVLLEKVLDNYFIKSTVSTTMSVFNFIKFRVFAIVGKVRSSRMGRHVVR